MSTKTKKGIFKPLKYFSNMFAENNKEPEMQIGMPTDVKHVAHIGWDGPSVGTTNPSWMKDYHSAPLNTIGAEGRESPMWGSQDFSSGSMEDLPVRQSPANSSDLNPTSIKPKHSRRNQSDGTSSNDSADGTRRNRKPRKKEAAGASSDSSAQQDIPAIPKQSNRRRTKGSGGSDGSSKSKAAASQDAEDGSIKSMPTATGAMATVEYVGCCKVGDGA